MPTREEIKNYKIQYEPMTAEHIIVTRGREIRLSRSILRQAPVGKWLVVKGDWREFRDN